MPDRGYDGGEGLVFRALRMVVPWVALVLILFVAWGYLGQYRDATRGGDSRATEEPAAVETSPSVEPEGDTDAAPEGAETAEGEGVEEAVGTRPYVKVLTEGLNLRSRPMTTATVIKTLTAGQQLSLIEKGSGWYHVRDAAGDEGWVAAGGRYTELFE
jgi:hypothetical protein